ncbi:MAG: XRE family transcriptional regulator [Chitinophagaceae bacterium]|nr:MAG: XRE family transcriptional regulator [Chitinophagaceae bacterium]
MEKITSMQIAQQLKAKRLNKGFTQQELADITGISLRSIQRIENGDVYPRNFTLKLLCEKLALDFEELNGRKVLPVKEQSVKPINKTQKAVSSCIIAIVLVLLASAFIFQSPTFPESTFEFVLLLAFVIAVYGVILFRIWR